MAVFPVWRSPMISSRWPRPMGIIASIALSPVCSGSFPGSPPPAPRGPRSRRGERVGGGTGGRVPHRHLHDAAGAANLVALLDETRLAHEHGADLVLLEV